MLNSISVSGDTAYTKPYISGQDYILSSTMSRKSLSDSVNPQGVGTTFY